MNVKSADCEFSKVFTGLYQDWKLSWWTWRAIFSRGRRLTWSGFAAANITCHSVEQLAKLQVGDFWLLLIYPPVTGNYLHRLSFVIPITNSMQKTHLQRTVSYHHDYHHKSPNFDDLKILWKWSIKLLKKINKKELRWLKISENYIKMT